MSWTFDNNKPIYLQIMDKIKLQIVSHKLEPNQQLPTVRELASEAGVNPNTIQRALSDLEREGFVYTKRTAGRFVTEDLDLILQSRKQLSEEQLQQFVTGMTLLTFENVSKFYGASPALQNVSLEIPAGKIVGLLGPNGSGKTTLIKLINGLLQPEQGRILINGMEPSPATKAIVSYLPDTTYLNEQMKVKEALTFFKTFYKDFNLERAQGLLRDLGIDENSRFKKLSKGNKEKVQLILVMSRDARLYVLDEPIGGVDPAARDYILNTIINNYSPTSTVLISTHLISDIEPILDEIVFLKDGKVVRQGNVDDIRYESGESIDQLFRHEFKA